MATRNAGDTPSYDMRAVTETTLPPSSRFSVECVDFVNSVNSLTSVNSFTSVNSLASVNSLTSVTSVNVASVCQRVC